MALVLVGIFFTFTNFVYRDEILSVDQWQQATKVHYQMGGAPLF
jgi:hypothetical protein